MDSQDPKSNPNQANGPEIGADAVSSPIGSITWIVVAILAVIMIVAALYLGGFVGKSMQGVNGTGTSANRSVGP